ncbi:cytochrome c and c1 heme-lyase [Xylona heveae TC161]|uniref:Holocytochrome c-type synthase n=1 Tax=Xylona heveae (strain CBS 132557 / TC161) TaxID=1328760 RepID=A0A165J5A5_XYLHT|nr:cytochrome c and c1 heme-lyase [Xylona heveae TC161]KZF25748.1 cytochrome c and c1 heme-lyase [Xylona heveae TC161]
MANDSDASACPVDHTTRTAWLEQARQQREQQQPQQKPAPPEACPVSENPAGSSESCPVDHHSSLRPGQGANTIPAVAATQDTQNSSSWRLFSFPKWGSWGGNNSESNTSNTKAKADTPVAIPVRPENLLATGREVSTIPRAIPSEDAEGSAYDSGSHSPMANNEQETGSDKSSGNWIYPSEQMFFNAMRRKNFDPHAEDMRAIVPIHNAVNERAWKEIKDWEKGQGSDKCGGPRLLSFSGMATQMTPRARLNTLMGYQAPFDRHDWIVDRCGTRVEYVIDFYSGRDEGKAGKSLNFYLDVRPKLNTWEGWRMRMSKFVGF